jgi:hypothetical protein
MVLLGFAQFWDFAAPSAIGIHDVAGVESLYHACDAGALPRWPTSYIGGPLFIGCSHEFLFQTLQVYLPTNTETIASRVRVWAKRREGVRRHLYNATFFDVSQIGQ